MLLFREIRENIVQVVCIVDIRVILMMEYANMAQLILSNHKVMLIFFYLHALLSGYPQLLSCHVRFSLYLIQVTDYYCKNVQFIQSILINAL